MQAFDYVQEEDEAATLPYLRDYLSIHPLFQLKDLEDEYSDIDYLSKTINHQYAKEIYVALVLAVQEDMLHFTKCKET